MNYEQALEYLQLIDTVLYSDQQFEQAINKAINAVHNQTHKGGEEKNCPLTTVCTLRDQRVDAIAPRR